ncbi:hypothetical protein [Noviherbaspirillum pedocola]|uniref:Uncharacterized protein n=1 Tax=Noviherbaspirillum pedocola TaxID=2801341 RepID=A0A934W2I0_9BURK|nr:hypothetical protein [Noviherbaspirillum pedocola]MBK4736346.1 hypothetical protein [Noviherbaspirillum pedocola]
MLAAMERGRAPSSMHMSERSPRPGRHAGELVMTVPVAAICLRNFYGSRQSTMSFLKTF